MNHERHEALSGVVFSKKIGLDVLKLMWKCMLVKIN